jgi:tetraacyldisaccharide 4'-kinase
LVSTLSAVYGAAAGWRRAWYARHPDRRQQLERPVVSVGNLRVGGTGKTPIVEHIARLFLEAGHRPAVLTRGYGRRSAPPGVTVVADSARVLAGLDTAGDEPLMLARRVPGIVIAVGSDRYLSGCLAERKLGATVHILDDGFQHVQLARDVDLLLTGEDDLNDRPLPAGRLRETLAAAACAHAAIVDAGDLDGAKRVSGALGITTAFVVARRLGEASMLGGGGEAVPRDARVFAVAGIARPERFFADLAFAGWQVAGTMGFRDHHPFTQKDVERIRAAAASASADVVLTTGKDAVRFESCPVHGVSIAVVPLHVEVQPADAFRSWLLARVGPPGRSR